MKKNYSDKAATGYSNKQQFYYPKQGVTIIAKDRKEADKKLLTTKDKANAATDKGGNTKGS